MNIFYSPAQAAHSIDFEIHDGQVCEPIERQERAEIILQSLERAAFPKPIDAWHDDFQLPPGIHAPDYITFLETIYGDWVAQGLPGRPAATFIPARRQKQIIPSRPVGKVGYYSLGCDSQISAGTWLSLKANICTVTAAQKAVTAENMSAFALCRPPGHHATKDQFGGYCFLNNAAYAAQGFCNGGMKRVAVLDIDYHHGNGTQDIFYERSDVFFISLHAEPEHAFPYFTGFADETGANSGEGYNLNLPLPPGTDGVAYQAALDRALNQISRMNCEALVVSLGTDIHADDPLGTFTLTTDDINRISQRIKSCALPTLIVMEGGYISPAFGSNVAAFLEPFRR